MGSRGDRRGRRARQRDAVAGARSAPYQLQAAIAAVHDEAARAEDTDWPQILALYGLLKRMSDNPMVALNHAIAVGDGARARGRPGAARRRSTPTTRLAGHYRLDAVRAHLLEMAGRSRRPPSRTTARPPPAPRSIPERNYLITQAARLLAATK